MDFRSIDRSFTFLPLLLGFFIQFTPSAEASHSWDVLQMNDNLYELRDQEILQGSKISEINQELIKEINNFHPPSRTRREGVTYQQAQYLIDKIAANRVTSFEFSDKYDATGEIGFCFGRALYVHLELLRHGVSKNAIKKAFLVGEMRSEGVDWRFHVTTVVKATDENGWYALDAIIGAPVFLEDWYSAFKSTALNENLRLFITEPSKFGPSAREYNRQESSLFDEYYNGYFRDMFQFFRDNHLSPEEKFISN